MLNLLALLLLPTAPPAPKAPRTTPPNERPQHAPAAPAPHAHPGGHHGPPMHGGYGQHGNPADMDRYLATLEEPDRQAWQKPDELVAALGLRPGQTACDVGSGPGYFTLRLAAAVGPQGRVMAVDVEPRMLEVLAQRVASSKLRHVTPVLGIPDDPLLPAASCDVVLVVNTYHHFPDRVPYLERLKGALKPGGSLVLVDFHARETPVGPPMDHRVSREQVLKEAALVGLQSRAEHTFLPHQYALVLAPR